MGEVGDGGEQAREIPRRRSGNKAHPPEDSSELHAAPELREVLEAHAVQLLEAAEQRLAVGLQAWRGPRACKRPRAHGTGPGVRSGLHARSPLANHRHPEPGPNAPTQLHLTRAPMTYYPGPQAPPSSGPLLAPAALFARA